MKLLSGFLPFAVFAAVSHLISTLLALGLAALTAVLLALRDRTAKKSLKLLDLGAALVFGGLAFYTACTGTAWSLVGVRLCTDLGLLAIVLVSLLVRQPFTLQYARELAPERVWASPDFVRKNFRLSAAWGAAFAAMALADLAMLHGFPLSFGALVTVGALCCSLFYTTQTRG